MKEIEFWFSIGSTYTYLSVTRLKEVEQKFEAKFSWKPFSVRKIMLEMDNVPFPPTKQVKADYMWRDIERRASSYGFEAKVPAPYPLKEFDLANKIAVIGMQEMWINSSFLDKFEKDSDIVLTDKFINGHLGGTSSLNLILDAEGQKDAFKKP
jgi:2-hydroxychromene-2-carboxylate isomerase